MTIKNITDLCAYLGCEEDELERALYKYTECGAWTKWDDNKVSIGSIVEGSDAEFSRDLYFPFESETYDAWIDELEDLTDEAWHEANGFEELEE